MADRPLFQAPQPAEESQRSELTGMLTRDQDLFILRVYGSSAVYKFDRGLKNETTFAEACRFWGINENLHGEALNKKLETLRATLIDIEGLVGDCLVELSNGG